MRVMVRYVHKIGANALKRHCLSQQAQYVYNFKTFTVLSPEKIPKMNVGKTKFQTNEDALPTLKYPVLTFTTFMYHRHPGYSGNANFINKNLL